MDDVSLYDMVRDLQDAKVGDSRRLAYILERIENGRTIYNSDENYVREKFMQLREDLTREPEETPAVHQHDATPPEPQPEPEPEPQPTAAPNHDRKPSKAWYALPIFLGILGGLIAFGKLRKRDRGMAYKNLATGIGITMILPALVMGLMVAESWKASNFFDSEPIPEYTNEEIMRQAVSVPYQSLVDQPDVHEGEVVRYEGTLLQVKNQFLDKYLLRVGVTQERFSASDVILLTYTPTSDEEKEWLAKTENELRPGQTDGLQTVTFWGISTGITEYDTVFGQKLSIPSVDAIIIERHEQARVDPEPQGEPAATPQSGASHTVSFSDIPAYVDESLVERAVIDAVREWDMINPDVEFTIVESDADVNLSWARYMPGASLGLHRASVTDEGNRERHSITVRLGIDDCHSDYQQFGHGTIQYIIVHEMGHYLGLRHVDDKSHLMHSGDLFNVDSADVYDDLGLGIPHLERPEIATVAGLEIQSQIDELNTDLDKVSVERQDLKDAGKSLDNNTETHNGLVHKIQKLEDQLMCVNLT